MVNYSSLTLFLHPFSTHAMKQHHLEKLLKNELQVLNRTIDYKIMKGLPYAKEAREHKFLLARLLKLQKASRQSIFSRLSFVPTLFL